MIKEYNKKIELYYNKLNTLYKTILKVYEIPYTIEIKIIQLQNTHYELYIVKTNLDIYKIVKRIEVFHYINKLLEPNNMSAISNALYYSIQSISKNDFQCFYLSAKSYNHVFNLIQKEILQPNISFYNNIFQQLEKILQENLNNLGANK